jgi:ubiquinone/menaquinone biosynthesis C-methylase UbiE
MPLLQDIRRKYFTQKYLDYDDEADVRSVIGDTWADDVSEAYAFLGCDVSKCDVLYVGVGTGRDLMLVCPSFRSLKGVDLSREMLDRAVERQRALIPVVDTAEELRHIDDESTDLYLSLRVYQSSLLDTHAALRQAIRVLRPGGSLVLSIPGGYVDRASDGELQVVPGLLGAGSSVADRNQPRRIATSVLEQLENLTFERIGFHQRGTDIYVYARKRARAAAR